MTYTLLRHRSDQPNRSVIRLSNDNFPAPLNSNDTEIASKANENS
jgi:hypothetical protein